MYFQHNVLLGIDSLKDIEKDSSTFIYFISCIFAE